MITQEQYSELKDLEDIRKTVLRKFLHLYYSDFNVVSGIAKFLFEIENLKDGETLNVPYFSSWYIQCYISTDGYDNENYRYFLWQERE